MSVGSSEMMNLLEQLERLGAADGKCITENEEVYLAQVKAFLEGQDFLRLGHGISGSNWNGVMMNVRRMRENCKKLGITCFDRWLMGIRDCAQRRNREEAVQLMTRITAKRVQLRRLFAEGK